MNTDGTVAEPLDNVGNDPHTHSVLFGDLATVTIGATEYYAFSLDLNEPAGDGQNYLSLDQIKIYSVDGSAGGSLLTEAAVLAATGGTLQYDMDDSNLDGNHTAGENQTTWLDYTNSNQDKDLGSGEDDMTVFIPTSFFAGVEATDYMYFLATFGSAGNVSDQSWYGEDGFEEWRVLSGGGGGGGGGGGRSGARHAGAPGHRPRGHRDRTPEVAEPLHRARIQSWSGGRKSPLHVLLRRRRFLDLPLAV
jgi:hypothetical protein